jgi:hypothetical protein
MRRARGEPDDEIRHQVISLFREEISGDAFDEFARESLIATARRAVERALSRERRVESPEDPILPRIRRPRGGW